MYLFFLMIHAKNGDCMNILIIGSTSGLAFDAGCRLLEKDHFVYFTTHYRNQVNQVINKLKQLGYSTNYKCFSLDITKKRDRQKITKLPIDCLFCHGAMGLGGSLFDLSIEQIRENFEVNVFSNMTLIKEYLETCLKKGTHGKIVITASLAGLMPVPFMDSYSATKAALISFATTLYYEQKIFSLPYSIKIIEPGIYKTGFNEYMLTTISKNDFFSSEKFCTWERKVFQFLSKKNYGTITKKMVNAIESSSTKFIYRAPLSQVIFLKIYLLLFK